ncbi:hypothetical protein BaRGS_00009862 [Batillaria attramentaria]|uniref:Uncharacterized protein n=1 Tax=Batillaria attramentaria TaxID=370345 RepID=A0ABD0LH49_9CAEN
MCSVARKWPFARQVLRECDTACRLRVYGPGSGECACTCRRRALLLLPGRTVRDVPIPRCPPHYPDTRGYLSHATPVSPPLSTWPRPRASRLPQ